MSDKEKQARLELLRSSLAIDISNSRFDTHSPDAKSWPDEIGSLISINEAKLIMELLDKESEELKQYNEMRAGLEKEVGLDNGLKAAGLDDDIREMYVSSVTLFCLDLIKPDQP